MDALLACGESTSAPLFAMCLHAEGIPATSLSGAQTGVRTNAAHGAAAVVSVSPERVNALIAAGRVPVVARGRVLALGCGVEIRGRGLLWGVDLGRAGGAELAKEVGAACFRAGLIVERCGRRDTVLKLMPPLNIELAVLHEGLDILAGAVEQALRGRASGEEVTALGRAGAGVA